MSGTRLREDFCGTLLEALPEAISGRGKEISGQVKKEEKPKKITKTKSEKKAGRNRKVDRTNKTK